MKKFKKLVATALVAVMVLTTMALSASAGIVFWHGNESKRCYASTTQDTTTKLIGAQITWQVKSGNIQYGDRIENRGAEAKSRSSYLISNLVSHLGITGLTGRSTIAPHGCPLIFKLS